MTLSISRRTGPASVTSSSNRRRNRRSSLIRRPKFTVNARRKWITSRRSTRTTRTTCTSRRRPATRFNPRVHSADRKRNIIDEYTIVTQMGVKFFKRGVADPKAGNFQFPPRTWAI